MSRAPCGSSIHLFVPAIIRHDNIGYYDVVTIPIKKDRNVEKTHTHTLSGVKGRAPWAPGAVINKEEIVIPDGSFFPLNLDPHGSESASPSDSERGPSLLHLSSLIIFLPHHPDDGVRSTATTSTHRMTHSLKTLMPANGNIDPAASYSMISCANSLGEVRQYDCVTDIWQSGA